MSIADRSEIFSEKKSTSVEVKLATIASGYVSGRPQLVFNGETTATLKTYPYLAHYKPISGDRVMLLKNVIVGKII